MSNLAQEATRNLVSGTSMTYQEVISNFIWNAIVLTTMIAIIIYILDHFGYVRAAPVIEGNVTEQVDEGFKGFGSFLKDGIVEGTKLARTLSSVVGETVNSPAVEEGAKQAAAAVPKKK